MSTSEGLNRHIILTYEYLYLYYLLIAQEKSNHEEEKKRLAGEMYELLYREELLWMQRSRVAWLHEGALFVISTQGNMENEEKQNYEAPKSDGCSALTIRKWKTWLL
jgi:hypothetical protein